MPTATASSRAKRWGLRGAVVVAAVLTLSALETQRRRVRLAEAHPPSGNLTTVAGVRLHYALAGMGAPVVLLHGSPGFLQDWQISAPGTTSVYDDLQGDHRVIALDRPGYGWSAAPAGGATLETQADLTAGLLRALNIDGATFVGHSYGGGLALATAARHPEVVRAVVFVGGVAYPERLAEEVDGLQRASAAPALGDVMRWCVAPLLVPPMAEDGLRRVFAPEGPPPGYVRAFTNHLARPEPLRQYGVEGVTMVESFTNVSRRYGDLDLPVTVIVGDLDVFPSVRYSSQRVAGELSGARLVELTGVGHEIPHLRPHVVAQEVRRLTRTAGQADTD